jgi:hypothetical protein
MPRPKRKKAIPIAGTVHEPLLLLFIRLSETFSP